MDEKKKNWNSINPIASGSKPFTFYMHRGCRCKASFEHYQIPDLKKANIPASVESYGDDTH